MGGDSTFSMRGHRLRSMHARSPSASRGVKIHSTFNATAGGDAIPTGYHWEPNSPSIAAEGRVSNRGKHPDLEVSKPLWSPQVCLLREG